MKWIGPYRSSVQVFVYGTLADREQAAAVIDDVEYRGAATLEGLHRVGGAYPTLAPGGSVEGRILATDDVTALDRYEGVDRGLYVRVSVPVAGERDPDESDPDDSEAGPGETVEVYVGDPDRLDAPVEWPGDGPFDARVRNFISERGGITVVCEEG